jgi:hypothetical protein
MIYSDARNNRVEIHDILPSVVTSERVPRLWEIFTFYLLCLGDLRGRKLFYSLFTYDLPR